MRLARCAGVGYIVEFRLNLLMRWYEVWVLKSQGQVMNDKVFVSDDFEKSHDMYKNECEHQRRQNDISNN